MIHDIFLNKPHNELQIFNFISKEESDKFKLERNLSMTDLERFRTFLSLMQMGKKLKNAPKIHKQID
jgi:hypothetical protein